MDSSGNGGDPGGLGGECVFSQFDTSARDRNTVLSSGFVESVLMYMRIWNCDSVEIGWKLGYKRPMIYYYRAGRIVKTEVMPHGR